MHRAPDVPGPRRRWLWFALPPLALGAMLALSPSPRAERDRLEALMPELRLVVRENDRAEGTTALYTGRADPEEIATRFDKALKRAGWQSPQRKAGSPFPYRNFYNPWDARPWWSRLSVLDRITAASVRRRPLVDFRVLRGRAGAKPTDGAWTTVLIRERAGIYGSGFAIAYEAPGPDTSEPVLGWGIQVR